MTVGMYGSGHYVHDLLALRRASGLHPTTRLRLHLERDRLLTDLELLDIDARELAGRRRRLLDELDALRDRLWPVIPQSRGRRPPSHDQTPLPPAHTGSRAISGRALRHAALAILQHEGALTLPDLHAALHHAGYHLDSKVPTRTLADAMGYEVDLRHAERIARGTYRVTPRWRPPRSRRGQPPPVDPALAWDPSDEGEPHLTPGVVAVEIDEDDGLPCPESRASTDDRQAERRTDEGGEQMICAVSGRPVGVAVTPVAREQPFEGIDEVLLRARSRLDHRQPHRGVGGKDIQQPLSMVDAEGSDTRGQVGDPPAGGVHVEQGRVHRWVLPHSRAVAVRPGRRPP